MFSIWATILGAKGKSVDRIRRHLQTLSFNLADILSVLILAAVAGYPSSSVHAAPSTESGKKVAERLQRGIDNPDQEDNIYRGGEAVQNIEKVKSNMESLFKPLLVTKSQGKVDKAYNPHLRDATFSQANRTEMATVRKKAGAMGTIYIPILGCWLCVNKFGRQSACDLCNRFPCPGHVPWFDNHIHRECCALPSAIDTSVYGTFTTDTNFKACCVRQDMVNNTEEQIACKSKHPLFNPQHFNKPRRGDGWSGLTEADFWFNAIGLENSQANTMLATRDEVRQCLKESDPLMENSQAANWVSGAIERTKDWAGKTDSDAAGPPAGGSGQQNVLARVQENIQNVRPNQENKRLRFADSLQGGALTVRPNLAVMDLAERSALAQRFCFRKEQFHKLMNPTFDPLQLGGGPDWRSLTGPEFLWATYCAKGVTLMTNPALSNITNLHRTSTDFSKGMKKWKDDPLYCQRIHAAENALVRHIGLEEVLDKSAQAAGASGGAADEHAVGYTCLQGGKLNTGMVPVTYLRNTSVERRTAIVDKLFAFLIAGTLVQNPKMAVSASPIRSFLKGFEPQGYSLWGPEKPAFTHETFIGRQVKGGGTNELGEVCTTINGNNYQFQNRSDQLYLSEFSHDPFTQEILNNTQKDPNSKANNGLNKYVQEFAKQDADSRKTIAKREVADNGSDTSVSSRDKNVHTYASTSRIVGVCPAGHVRWRPPADAANADLIANLGLLCREQNFGSPVFHQAP